MASVTLLAIRFIPKLRSALEPRERMDLYDLRR